MTKRFFRSVLRLKHAKVRRNNCINNLTYLLSQYIKRRSRTNKQKLAIPYNKFGFYCNYHRTHLLVSRTKFAAKLMYCWLKKKNKNQRRGKKTSITAQKVKKIKKLSRVLKPKLQPYVQQKLNTHFQKIIKRHFMSQRLYVRVSRRKTFPKLKNLKRIKPLPVQSIKKIFKNYYVKRNRYFILKLNYFQWRCFLFKKSSNVYTIFQQVKFIFKKSSSKKKQRRSRKIFKMYICRLFSKYLWGLKKAVKVSLDTQFYKFRQYLFYATLIQKKKKLTTALLSFSLNQNRKLNLSGQKKLRFKIKSGLPVKIYFKNKEIYNLKLDLAPYESNKIKNYMIEQASYYIFTWFKYRRYRNILELLARSFEKQKKKQTQFVFTFESILKAFKPATLTAFQTDIAGRINAQERGDHARRVVGKHALKTEQRNCDLTVTDRQARGRACAFGLALLVENLSFFKKQLCIKNLNPKALNLNDYIAVN